MSESGRTKVANCGGRAVTKVGDQKRTWRGKEMEEREDGAYQLSSGEKGGPSLSHQTIEGRERVYRLRPEIEARQRTRKRRGRIRLR